MGQGIKRLIDEKGLREGQSQEVLCRGSKSRGLMNSSQEPYESQEGEPYEEGQSQEVL